MTFASILKVTKFELALNSFIKSLEEISNHSNGRTNVRKYKCDVKKVVEGMLEALHGVGHPNEAKRIQGWNVAFRSPCHVNIPPQGYRSTPFFEFLPPIIPGPTRTCRAAIALVGHGR